MVKTLYMKEQLLNELTNYAFHRIKCQSMTLRNALWVTFEVLRKNTYSWFLLQVADDISRPRQVLLLKCLFHPK